MRNGIVEVTFCTNGNTKGLEWVHGGATSGARVGIVLDKVTATRAADSMGHVTRGVEGDKGINIAQANETLFKAEMDGRTD